jgi:RHS repeat-associated protein
MKRVIAASLIYVYLASLMQACGLGPNARGPSGPEAGRAKHVATTTTAITVPVASEPAIPADAIVPTDNDGAPAPLTQGETSGNLTVTVDGETTYKIKLWVPPGRNGIQPDLALNYRSRAGNGPLGVGWSLSGLGAIDRCGQSFAQDGNPAAVNFGLGQYPGQPQDHFCLDGARLVKTSGFTYGANGTIYHTEEDAFVKVVSNGGTPTSPASFTVYAKDGRILDFAYAVTGQAIPNTASLVPPATVTAQWLLSAVRDRAGNKMTITYRLGSGLETEGPRGYEVLPDTITYTSTGTGTGSRQVVFQWEGRPDHESHYVSGWNWLTANRLSMIVMNGPGLSGTETLRVYKLSYFDSAVGGVSATKRSLLRSVQECVNDTTGPVCMTPTSFSYELGDTTYTDIDLLARDPSLADLFQAETGTECSWCKFNDLKVLDANGDGLDDILYRRTQGAGSDGTQQWRGYYHLRLNSGALRAGSAGAVFNPSLDPTIPTSSDVPDTTRVADLNGDGKTDVVSINRWFNDLTERGNRQYEARISNGVNFSTIATLPEHDYSWSAVANTPEINYYYWSDYDQQVVYETQYANFAPAYIALGDADGDGITDIAWALRSDVLWYLHLGQISGSTYSVGPAISIPITPPLQDACGPLVAHKEIEPQEAVQVEMIDVFGRGKTGVLVDDSFGKLVWTSPVDPYHYAFSTNLRAARLVAGPHVQECDGKIWFADLNGDGLPDALRSTLSDSTAWSAAVETPSVAINTGAGYTAELGILPGSVSTDLQKTLVLVTDYDGDGRQDFLLATPGTAKRQTMLVLRPTGDWLNPFEILDTRIPTSDKVNANLTTILDLNGDGQDDVLVTGPDIGVHAYVRNGKPPDVLKSVTTGLGAKQSITYRPINDPAVVTSDRNCTYPQRCLVRGVWVASQVDADSGGNDDDAKGSRTFKYTYRNALLDVAGRGWLGFEQRTVTDVAANATSTEYFDLRTRINDGTSNHYAYPYKGKPTRTEYSTGDFKLSTTIHYTVRPSANGFFPYFVFADRTDVQETDTTFIRYVTGVQDVNAVGSMVFRETTTADGAKRTERSYYDEDNLGGWLVGRPTKVEISETTATGESVTRTKGFHYDPTTGLLLTETTEPGSSDPQVKLTISYFREDGAAPGLVTHISSNAVDPLTAEPMVRDTYIQYEGRDHLFPVAVTNGLGHQQLFAFHRGLGVPLVLVDANGVVTEIRHDRFGRDRSVRVRDATGANQSRNQSRNFAFPSNRKGIRYLESGTQGTLDALSDFLGHEQATTTIVGGKRSVVSRKFDDLGRLAWVSEAGWDGVSQPYGTRYSYDNRSRLKQVKKPYDAISNIGSTGGGLITFTYSGLRVTRTDEKGRVSYVDLDPTGSVVASVDQTAATDPGGARDVKVTHTYGPFGLPKTTTDALGSVSSFTWDILGRRTYQSDPDSGAETVVYNAFGEVAKVTGADAKDLVLHRDVLGRLTLIDSSDGQTVYNWDTDPAHGLGQIGSASSPDGVSVSYTFDSLSRRQNEDWTVAGQTLSIGHTYDPVSGLLQTVTYPAVNTKSLMVQYEYDDQGAVSNVYEVLSATSKNALWTATQRDSAGRLTSQTFGNGVVSTRAFDGVGQLRFLETKLPSTGNALQRLAYEFNADGSLSAQHDLLSGTSEDFGYDSLDRLTKWTVTQCGTSGSVTFVYDDGGNLRQRISQAFDEVTRTFGYGENGAPAHAVSSMTVGTTTTRFSYEAGNQKNGLTWSTQNYKAFGLPADVTTSAGPVTFSYGPFQARALMALGNGDYTLYAGDLYQQRRVADTRTHVLRVLGPEGPILERTLKDDGTTLGDQYLLADRLGSIETVTDGNGALLEHRKYEPYGQRRDPDHLGRTIASNPSRTREAFGSHEADDESGLLNMRGRIYDPALAQFTTPDQTLGQARALSQRHNRFRYAARNPLRWVDPTGFIDEGGDDTGGNDGGGGDGSISQSGTDSGALGSSPGDVPGTTGIGEAEVNQLLERLNRQEEEFSGRSPPSVAQTADLNGARDPVQQAKTTGDKVADFFSGIGTKIAEAAPGLIIGAVFGVVLGPIGVFALAATFTLASVATHGVGAGVDAIIPVRPLIGAVGTLSSAIRKGDWRTAGEATAEIGFDAAAMISAGGATRKIATNLVKKNAYSMAFEFKLKSQDIGRSDSVHFRRANEGLATALKDPEYAAMMEEMIPGVTEAVNSADGLRGKAPEGWTWHHASNRTHFRDGLQFDDPTGLMQLVPTWQHRSPSAFQAILHPGGRGGYAIWAVPAGAPPRH